MSNIYLRVRLESEYLTHLSKLREETLDTSPFLWCFMAAQANLVRVPTKRQLSITAAAVTNFLSLHGNSLNIQELKRVCDFETATKTWLVNSRTAYGRALDFLNLSVEIYYEFVSHTMRMKASSYALFLRHLFERLELELLRILENDFQEESRVEILSSMERIIDHYNALNRAELPELSAAVKSLQDTQELFEVESLLNP